MASATHGSSAWLRGPARDLLLGCGLGYALLFPFLLLLGPETRVALHPALLPVATLLVGAPHYGATLLRVYERRDDRRAYALFAVYASLLLLVLFVLATRAPGVGSLLVTLYVTWSPWHYSGQNYGIAVLFARRRGLALDRATKRMLYLGFLLSFALTFLALHAEGGGATYAPGGGRTASEGTYPILILGIPRAVALPALALAAAGSLLTSATALWRLSRGSAARDVLPVASLLLTQALWFSVPVVARTLQWNGGYELLGDDHTAFYFFFAAMGHVLQYLWITGYVARSRPGYPGPWRYGMRCLLAGVAIFTLPALLFAPGVLGQVPFGFGLAMLVAAAVNLHHFVLDGAIWKLRDGRLARILVRRPDEPPRAAPRPLGSRGWLAHALLALGLGCLAVNAVATWETVAGMDAGLARGDLARAERAAERLRWLGRANPLHHLALAEAHSQRHEAPEALVELERALALRQTPELAYARAGVLEALGRNAEALEAYEQVLALDPDHAESHFRLSRMWHLQARPERALEAIRHAVTLAPGEPRYRAVLEALEAAAGTQDAPGAATRPPPAGSSAAAGEPAARR